jgi:LPS O-antigen subunit length determinant protein (WzzB/FepE family)
MEENEVQLIDILNVIWKRKWLIIIATLLCVIMAGVVSLLLPKKWEINMIILPSKFYIKTAGGEFEEIEVIAPKQIAGQINQASYNSLIAAELNLDIRDFPKLQAENIRNMDFVRISIKDIEAKKAIRILNSLFIHLKRDLDAKADIEIREIDAKIKSKEVEKRSIDKEIKAFKNKLNNVEQRKKEIEGEIGKIKERIKLLEKEQRLILKKDNRSEAENLAILLYSGEMHQGLQYHNTLTELLDGKRKEEENISLEIGKKAEKIKQIENEISNLNETKRRVDFTKLIKEPTVSVSPVSPKKKLNIIIAGILGLIVFTMLAFFLEYIEKQRAKS